MYEKGDAKLSRYHRGEVELPHQCGEWHIGGPAEIRVLMVDLAALLERIERTAKGSSK